MQAEDLIKAGDIDGALASLQDRIRKAPQDASLRVFLFQLLCIQGDWPRAILQLKTCATLDPATRTMAQMYREAIICEVTREKIFAGQTVPEVFGDPDPWMTDMIAALTHQIDGDQSAADDLRARAFDAAPTADGTLNNKPFNWIADADPRFGPMLEIIIAGRYYWAPFSTIQHMTIAPPSDLRDAVWTAATITWAHGGDAIGLIPTRYPGSTGSADPAHRLARATDWAALGQGLGQRMFVTDTDDHALLEVRDLSMGNTDG